MTQMIHIVTDLSLILQTIASYWFYIFHHFIDLCLITAQDNVRTSFYDYQITMLNRIGLLAYPIEFSIFHNAHRCRSCAITLQYVGILAVKL